MKPLSSREATTELVAVPATYRSVSETVVVTPQTVDYATIPATYETYQDTVVVQEASTELVAIPATYRTVTETVVVQEASTELVTIPATYRTVNETVVVQPQSVEYVSVPAKFRSVTENYVAQDATERMVIIPAVYDNVTETIVTQEASSSLRAVPATYRTVNETIVVQPARTEIQVIPATYETRSERVLISPAREEWKPGSQALNYGTIQRSGRINTNTPRNFTVFNGTSEQVVQSTQTIVNQTGEILCRVLIPAQYKTITKRVIKTPARTAERTIPAVTRQITRRVVANAASVQEVTNPAQTSTITRRTVRTPARVMTYSAAKSAGLLTAANGWGANGTIRGFVDNNSDGSDDRDGLSRSAAAAADRRGNGSRAYGSGMGQQMGTVSKRVLAEDAKVVERIIPAVTKQISRRVVEYTCKHSRTGYSCENKHDYSPCC